MMLNDYQRELGTATPLPKDHHLPGRTIPALTAPVHIGILVSNTLAFIIPAREETASVSSNPTDESERTTDPTEWSAERFEEQWRAYLASLIATNEIPLPPERIRFQAEDTPAYQIASGTWGEMNGDERVRAWHDLLQSVPQALAEVSPVCVQCGQCCKEGSPSLHIDDLELLRTEAIPWHSLLTLRRGEPARSLQSGAAFFATEERIKLRQKPGTTECVFFDPATSDCSIYPDRPLECRAQACWDPEPANEVTTEPLLTRRHLFANVGALLDLFDAHDQRCSFDRMREVFEDLKQSEGRNVANVIELLVLDESFRDLVCEKLNVPERVIELLFGRSLSERVRLFGFRVIRNPDGSRALVPADG
jgi:Fe-S-cluster containining protein